MLKRLEIPVGAISNSSRLTILHPNALGCQLDEVRTMFEDKVEAAVVRECSSRMVSRQKGVQILLTGYSIASTIGLLAMNAAGLSPLIALLMVWLGGGVLSVCIAAAMASASAPELMPAVASYWRNQFGADYQRS